MATSVACLLRVLKYFGNDQKMKMLIKVGEIMAYQYPFANVEERGKKLVWNKGRKIDGYDSDMWRYDICGNVMKYIDHGDTNSKHGWEIDHIKPVSKGGGNELDNLQPLQWENNRSKGDKYPWNCGK